jgi:hypothetical protein
MGVMKAALTILCLSIFICSGCSSPGGRSFLTFLSAACGAASNGMGQYQMNQMQSTQFQQQQQIYNLQHPYTPYSAPVNPYQK